MSKKLSSMLLRVRLAHMHTLRQQMFGVSVQFSHYLKHACSSTDALTLTVVDKVWLRAKRTGKQLNFNFLTKNRNSIFQELAFPTCTPRASGRVLLSVDSAGALSWTQQHVVSDEKEFRGRNVKRVAVLRGAIYYVCTPFQWTSEQMGPAVYVAGR